MPKHIKNICSIIKNYPWSDPPRTFFEDRKQCVAGGRKCLLALVRHVSVIAAEPVELSVMLRTGVNQIGYLDT